jgi:hypothetical protein
VKKLKIKTVACFGLAILFLSAFNFFGVILHLLSDAGSWKEPFVRAYFFLSVTVFSIVVFSSGMSVALLILAAKNVKRLKNVAGELINSGKHCAMFLLLPWIILALAEALGLFSGKAGVLVMPGLFVLMSISLPCALDFLAKLAMGAEDFA